MRPTDAQILAAAHAIGAANLVTVIWLDTTLRIQHVFGPEIFNTPPQAHIGDALPFLFGLDDSFAALTPASDPLYIPNVALIQGDDDAGHRHNVSAIRHTETGGFLVMVTPVLSADDYTSDHEHHHKRMRLMERDIVERTGEIERINRQLGEFTHIISHDLNAPLRAIRYFNNDIRSTLTAIATKISNQSGDTAPDLSKISATLDNLDSQTRRMSNMLVGLLEYSSIGRRRDAIETVNTQTLIKEVVRSSQPATPLDIVINGPWPIIDTAAAPLDLVLRNLIDNAIKHHDRPHGGHVTITSYPQKSGEPHWRIDVSDDGPGIPAEWQDAIFQPFTRIDDRQAADSTGLGLTLIKKTAKNLGGDVVIQPTSTSQTGTTFTVHWPNPILSTSNN